MAKEYRRFIRIDGRVIPSPRFPTKRDADLWYKEIKRQKDFGKHGIKVSSSTEITFLGYTRGWIQGRMKAYPEATWRADEQRLRDYLLPELADVPLSRVSSKMIRSTLKRVTDAGLSIETRTRVKALTSKIFSDAFNEELIPFNPAHGIKFSERRMGKKKPEFLTTEEAVKFIGAAVDLGASHRFIAYCGLFLGLRKSEIIPIKAEDFNWRGRVLTVKRRLEQASMSVKPGTKSGEYEERSVPIPIGIVNDFKRCVTDLFSDDREFLLPGTARPFMAPRKFHDMVLEIAKTAQIKTSAHKLRHTFGREFVISGGGIKALQAILGHSVSATTDRYSNLDGRHVERTSDAISYGVRSDEES